jgi:hypothetical protein
MGSQPQPGLDQMTVAAGPTAGALVRHHVKKQLLPPVVEIIHACCSIFFAQATLLSQQLKRLTSCCAGYIEIRKT